MKLTKGSTLDRFWKLSENKEKQRVDAALNIIFSLQLSKEKNDSDFQDNLKYNLQRFVSGLASDRVTSRSGYFIGLVELLKTFTEEINVNHVFDLISKHLNVKGSKSEEADFICGRMLCYGAILRSKRATSSDLGNIFERLIELSAKRSYLSVAAIKFLVDHLENITNDDFAEKIWPVIEDKCRWKGQDSKIESWWLLLEIHDKFPNIPRPSDMQVHFQRKELLSIELAKELAHVLMNGSTNLKIISQGPVFKGIVNALSKSQPLLKAFWFDEILPKVDKESRYKTSLAFGLLKLIIPAWKDQETIAKLISPELAQVSLQLLAKVEATQEDDAIVLSALDSMIEILKNNPKGQKYFLKTLLGVNMTYDKVTGSSIVQKLLLAAPFETVQYAASLFQEALQGLKPDGSTYSVQERVYSGQQLSKLVGHPSTVEEIQWKTDILCFIFTMTQFVLKEPYGSVKTVPLALARDARQELRETFFKALDVKVKSLENVCKILVNVVMYADELLSKSNVGHPYQDFGGYSKKAWADMMNAIKNLNNQEGQKVRKEQHVFQMLLIHVGFQLFSSGDVKSTLELLSDLHVCYDKATSKGKKKKDEPHWVEVVTDLMLSLLSQNRHVLRQVVNSVTGLLCPHMTQKALMAIMEVINPLEDANEEDEDMDDDDEFEPIPEEERLKLQQKIHAEQEEAEAEEEEVEDEASESESDSEEESEDDENVDGTNNGDAEPTAELRNQLKAAMGKDADSDAESVDMDDMDDQTIEKLNTMLGQVFRQLSGKKSGAEKRKEKKDNIAQIHFKLRALDMIDNYLSHHPAMSNVIVLSVPLIKALENANKDKEHAPLETRLRGTLKKLTSLKKLELDSELNGDLISELLKALVDLGNSGSPVVGQMNHPVPLFAQLGNLMVKCSHQLKNKKADKNVKQCFNKALNDFFFETQCLIPMTFFQLPLQGTWQGILTIVPKLIQNGFSNETRNFRRIQAVTLLSTVLHNPNLKTEIELQDLKNLGANVQNLLNDYLNDKVNLKQKMVCELLHLIHGLHGLSDLDGKKDILDWDEMKKLLEKLRAKVPKNRHFQDVKKAFNKISAQLKVQVVMGSEKKLKNGTPTDADEKNDENDEQSEQIMDLSVNGNNEESKKSKKKKKKKQSKETLQKRKERKKFELEDQYKNLEMPSFKTALVDNINLDVAAEPPKKKKKTKVNS